MSTIHLYNYSNCKKSTVFCRSYVMRQSWEELLSPSKYNLYVQYNNSRRDCLVMQKLVFFVSQLMNFV